jgi:hypothetical protein
MPKNKLIKLGFVLDELAPGHLSYVCITECNNWLNKNVGTNISLFYEDITLTCVPVNFARFHVRDSCFFDSNLICTSFRNLISTEHASTAKRFYYINDLEWTRSWFRYTKDQVQKFLNDDSIIKFTRCQDYYDNLKSNGYNIHKKIVKDFDIQSIMEIIND